MPLQMRLLAFMVLCAIRTCAVDFPLTAVRLPALAAWESPGRCSGSLQFARPAAVRSEPKSTSSRPLYGTLDSGMSFRLDESNGTGNGYDQLIIDLNANGDLRDDGVINAEGNRNTRKTLRRRIDFGPVDLSPRRPDEHGRFGFYAEIVIFDPKALSSDRPISSTTVGLLLLKPAWCLEATVSFNAVKERIRLLDGNCNFQLADRAQLPKDGSLRSQDWDALPVDYVLRGLDGTAEFRRSVFRDEAQCFADPIYFGGRPFTLLLSENLSVLGLQPYAGSLATLMVSTSNAIQNLTLLRDSGGGYWDTLAPQVINGQAAVPCGEYSLYRCKIGAKTRTDVWTVGVGFVNAPGEIVTVKEGERSVVKCGTPLLLRVEATNTTASSIYEMIRGQGSFSGQSVFIKAEVIGAGAEVYPKFYQGKSLRRLTPLKGPRFEVLNERGWRIGSGRLDGRQDQFYTKNWPVPRRYTGQKGAVQVEFDLGPLNPGGSPLKSEPIEVQL